jgi:hypothetical protein
MSRPIRTLDNYGSFVGTIRIQVSPILVPGFCDACAKAMSSMQRSTNFEEERQYYELFNAKPNENTSVFVCCSLSKFASLIALISFH